jgi:hypothetical protein
VTTPLPIQPRPPIRGGLASVAAPLGIPESEWRVGVEVRSTPDGGVFMWDTCGPGGTNIDTGNAIVEKPVSPVGVGAPFFPVTIEKVVECGPGATQTAIGDIARETARGSLDRQVYKVLARVFQGLLPNLSADGVPGGGINQYVSTPPGFDSNNPKDLRGTLQELLYSVCDCSNSDPIFHVPRAWMPHFIAQDLVEWDELTGKFWFGPHEVSFDCYFNRDPTGSYATAVDGSEVWIFATARPMVAVSAEDDVRVLERRQNTYTALVERHAIIAFDPTCVRMSKASVAT